MEQQPLARFEIPRQLPSRELGKRPVLVVRPPIDMPDFCICFTSAQSMYSDSAKAPLVGDIRREQLFHGAIAQLRVHPEIEEILEARTSGVSHG